MRKGFLKILAFLIVAIQLLSLVSFAQEYSTEEQLLEKLGVISIDENYSQDAAITRAEFTTAVVKMVKMNPDLLDIDGVKAFFDIDEEHKYHKYINAAYVLNIVRGGTDGCFRPDAPITLNEAATILVRAIGGDELIQFMGSAQVVAQKLHILDNVSQNAEGYLTNKLSALMMYNTMNSPAVVSNYDGSLQIKEDSTLFGTIFKLKYKTGILEANHKYALAGEPMQEGRILVDGEAFIVNDDEYGDYCFGMNVKVFYDKDTYGQNKAVYIEPIDNEVIELDGDDIVTLSYNKLTYASGNSIKSKNIALNSKKLYNGKRCTISDTFDIPDNCKISFINNDKDKDIDVVIIWAWDIHIAGGVSEVNDNIYFKNSTELITPEDFEVVRIKRADGSKMEMTDIAENDVLEVSMSVENNAVDYKILEITVVSEKATLEIYSLNNNTGKNYYTVKTKDDKIYRTVAGFGSELKSGGTYELALDSRGYICYIIQELSNDMYKLGYVMGIDTKTVFETTGKVMIYNTQGKAEIAEINKKVRYLNDGTSKTVAEVVSILTEPQVIRYKLNNQGKLIQLETASNDKNYDGLQFVGKTSDTNGAASKYLKNGGLIGGKIPINNDTAVVMLKDKALAGSEENYSITSGSSLENGFYPNSFAYKIGKDAIYSDIVVQLGANAQLSSDSSIMVVTELVKVWNKDDESVKIALTGYVGSAIKTITLSDNELINYVPATGDPAVAIGKGDCVRYVLDLNGEINELKLTFDFSERRIYNAKDTQDRAGFGEKVDHIFAAVYDRMGPFLQILPEGNTNPDEYLYSLLQGNIYQVSDDGRDLECEIISYNDILSLKNNSLLTDRVFILQNEGRTKITIVYKY